MATARENTMQLKEMLKDLSITANEFARSMVKITEFIEREEDIKLLEVTAEDFKTTADILITRANSLRLER